MISVILPTAASGSIFQVAEELRRANSLHPNLPVRHAGARDEPIRKMGEMLNVHGWSMPVSSDCVVVRRKNWQTPTMFADQPLDVIEGRCRALGLAEIKLSRAVTEHRTLVTDIRRGRSSNGERLQKICDALGLEFYIGLPRCREDTYAASGQTTDSYGNGTLREEVADLVKAETASIRDEVAKLAARIDPDAGTMRRIREADLVIPTLVFLALQPDGAARTKDIIAHLEEWFRPGGDDAEALKGRADWRFSQVVRNMISHRQDTGSFIRNGYAEYLSDLRITNKGRRLLKELVNESDIGSTKSRR